MRELIHFTHIPKCGGTSFRKGLIEAYGDRACIYYMNPLRHRFKDRLSFAYSRIKHLVAPNKSTADYDIVYGHFCFNDLYLPHNRPIKRGAFFRDPIEWVGSYFFYIRNKYPKEISDDPLKLIKDLGLERGFRQYLGRYNVCDLDFVGLAETYNPSLALYEKMFGKTIPDIYANKTSDAPQNYRHYFANQGLLEEIHGLMQENEEIYQAAVKRNSDLLKEYDISQVKKAPIHKHQ